MDMLPQILNGIAPYLSPPLIIVVIGILAIVFFYRALVESGLLQKLNSDMSGKVLLKILRGIFIIALISILLGFATYLTTLLYDTASSKEAIKGELKKIEKDIQTTILPIPDEIILKTQEFWGSPDKTASFRVLNIETSEIQIAIKDAGMKSRERRVVIGAAFTINAEDGQYKFQLQELSYNRAVLRKISP